MDESKLLDAVRAASRTIAFFSDPARSAGHAEAMAYIRAACDAIEEYGPGQFLNPEPSEEREYDDE